MSPFLHLREEAFQGDACRPSLRQLLAAHALAAQVRVMAGLALVLDDSGHLSGLRRLVEADDLDRIARPCLAHLLAPVVVERAHLAPGIARDDRVADVEGAALDEHRRHRAAAHVEPGLDDRPRRLGLRVRGQLELRVGDEQHSLEEVVEVSLLLGGHVGELRRPAPLLRLQVFVRQLGAHPLRVRVRGIDLVDGDHDRHLGRAGVRDRLLRLRHDAVVRGHDEDGDVGHLRPAGAHRGERFVARRVEERDPAAVVLDLVRADVLRDAAGLGLDDRGLADRVEERRLAVVDVAHDRDHGRTRDEILLGVLEDLRKLVLVGHVLDRDLALDLGRDQLHGLVRERLGDRDHLPQAHQDLDDLGRRHAERLGQVLDRHPGGDGDRTGRLRAGPGLRARLDAIARLPAVEAWPRGGVVDDDAPLAAPARGLTWPDGPVRTISLGISHGCLLQCKDARGPVRPESADAASARRLSAKAPARSTRDAGTCRRRAPARSGQESVLPPGPRTARARPSRPSARSRRRS